MHSARLLLMAALLAMQALPCRAALERAEIVRLAASVLRIEVPRERGAVSLGSAVAVGHERVVTNCHVTRDGHAIHVLRGGVRWPAQALRSDFARDLCLLAVPGLQAPVVPLGHASGLAIGQRVAALGYTGGAGLQSSAGQVLELHRHDGGHVIQSNNRFSSGASGGGLFDEQARLVGILTFRLRGGDAHYFAAPVEWVRQMLELGAGLPEQGAPTLPYWQAAPSQQPLFLQAATLQRDDRWNDLATLTRQWLRQTSGDAEPWHLLGLALAQLNRPQAVRAALECSLHLAPSHITVRSHLDRLRAHSGAAVAGALPNSEAC
jgi:serine protease Do